MTVVFLLTLRIFAFLINFPLVMYHAYLYLHDGAEITHATNQFGYRFTEKRFQLEPTDVFRQLPYRKRESFIKLGFYLLSFFYYLFSTVSTLVQ